MARNTISARIALEGADEIRKQLDELGEGGVKAFAKLQKAAEDAGGLDKIAPQSLKKLKDEFVSLGVTGEAAFNKVKTAVASASRLEQFTTAIRTAENGVSSLATAALALGRALGPIGTLVAVGVGAAVGAIAGLATSAAASAEELGLSALRAGTSVEAYDNLRGAFNAAGQSSKTFKTAIEQLTAAISAAAPDQIKAIADNLAKLKTAGVIDVSGLTQLREAAKGIGPEADAATTALDKLGMGAGKLSPNIKQLHNPLEGAKSALGKLGISALDATGKLRSPIDVLPAVADAFAKMADGPEKTALSIRVFGNEIGPKLIPLLNQGSAQIGKLADDYQKAGLNIATSQVEAGRKLNETYTRIDASSQRLKDKLGLMFAPALAATLEYIDSGLTKVSDFLKGLPWDQIGPAAAAAWAAVSQAASIAWEAIKSAASTAWEGIKGFFSQTVPNAWQWIKDTFLAAVQGLQETAVNVYNNIAKFVTTAAAGAWEWIKATFVTALSGINEVMTTAYNNVVKFVTTPVTGAWEWIVTSLQGALDKILERYKLLLSKLPSLPSLTTPAAAADNPPAPTTTPAPDPTLWQTAWQAIVAASTQGAQAVVAALQSAVEAISQAAGSIQSAFEAAFQAITVAADTAAAAIIAAMQRAAEAARAAASTIKDAGSAAGGGGAGQEFASGGRVRGPGSGTSDSILAWLSDGEFVVRAKAVRHFGTRFFELLNQLKSPGLNAGGFVNGLNHSLSALAIPRFADGGLALAPAMAGGNGGNGRTFSLNFGNQTFGGLTGPDKVMDALERHASMQALSAAGRAPGWVK